MNVTGARILVPGATGAIGSALSERLHQRGAHIAVAGRDREALARLADVCGNVPSRRFDAYDLDTCADTVTWAHEALDGLDAVVVCVGVAGFGPAEAVGDAVAEHLVAVNALAPMAFLRAALPLVPRGGLVAAVTGIVVDMTPAGMADYTASKAALAYWLSSVRREQRRKGVDILDLRLDHVESGFAQRAVVGTPPDLPRGQSVQEAVDKVMEALEGAGGDGSPRGPEKR
ncbi:SDR family NAD(P)-dependent oxidoreductase [Streptomyces rubiginosohelvolus]|uniref:SDR family NAD(P)-dependent oxidoreductase n=1 Tax=Streptomyces rubiginosohelvolus TaxID=67362 RepID=UPI00368293A8